MARGPGYALGEFLAEHGARVTIHETKYVHEMTPNPPPPVQVERITLTLPDGTQLGMDVRFEEDA
jgi:hypothetical protein